MLRTHHLRIFRVGGALVIEFKVGFVGAGFAGSCPDMFNFPALLARLGLFLM